MYLNINMRRLSLEDIKIARPDFTKSKIPKGQVISLWLIEWAKYALEHGIADIGDLIPSKEEFADFLGVSTATIQNSIRYGKNLGYFVSRQSIGTTISDIYSKDLKFDDTIFKGNIAECKIKKIVIDQRIKFNYPLPSIKELSNLTQISQNTIRASLNKFETEGYLKKARLKGNKYCWIYIKEFELSEEEIKNGIKDENFTLSHQLVNKIQEYLEKTYKKGDKILPNLALSNMFDVSIKTINDAMKVLSSKGVILSRRGKYGTIYLGRKSKDEYMTLENKTLQSKDNKKYIYAWQKALSHLKKHIIENYKAGDKIATIRELASVLKISPNTVRRALLNLIQSGNLISKRGKSGGIYIVEMPPKEEETYRWLALNPDVLADI